MSAAAQPRGLFVTGTGTGVGKSIVASAIVHALRAEGLRVGAFKPVVTGLDEPDPVWPMDHELLADATGWQSPEAVTPHTFGPAASPHLAAELAEAAIDPATIRSAFDDVAAKAEVTVCEGVGGLMVPLATDPPYCVLDLVKSLALPVVVATHPGLGTISDTRLTVDRLRSEGLAVAAVVLSGWPEESSTIERSNRDTIAGLTDLPVATLPFVDRHTIADAATALPASTWL